jgi:hypothetical protein
MIHVTHDFDIPLNQVSNLSYSTKQLAASDITNGNATLRVSLSLNGGTAQDEQLMYEPYYNGFNGNAQAGWQTWNLMTGKFWSNWGNSYNGKGGEGAGGYDTNFTIADVLHDYPNAKVVGLILSMGDYNPSQQILVDNVKLNGLTYDFEPIPLASPSNLRLFNVNGEFACGGATNINNVTPTWDVVAGATSYNYKVTLPSGAVYGPTNVGNVTSVTGPFGAEGLSTFSVQAVNANGLTSDWATPCEVTYDATAPETPKLISTLNNGYEKTNNFYFTWTNSSDGGSQVKYEFQSSGSNNLDNNGSLIGAWNSITNGNNEQNNLTTPTIHSTGAPDGTYYWQVRAIDVAGNKSAWSLPWKMTIDTDSPATPNNLTPADGKSITTANLTKIDWTDVSDSSMPVSYYYQSSYSNLINLDGSFVSPAYSSGALSISEIPTPNTPEGTYFWHARAVDAAGNSSAWSNTWKILVDNTAPTATFNFPIPGTSSKSFQVQFNKAVNMADASNPANYFLNNWPGAGGSGNLSDNATVEYDNTSHMATVTFTNPGWYLSAEQQWGVQGIHDLAGNLMSPDPTTAYSTPLVNPTTPGTPTTVSPTNSDKLEWSWESSTDPGGVNASGVKGYYYELTKGLSVVQNWSFTGSPFAMANVLSDGQYVLHVYAIDNAGNVSAEVTGEAIVDTVLPVVLITSPTINSFGNNATVNIQGTIDDAVGYKLFIDGTLVNSGSKFLGYDWDTTGITNGTHTIKLEATDLAGNSGSNEMNVNINNTASNTAPVTLNPQSAFNRPTTITTPLATTTDNGGGTVADTTGQVLGDQTTKPNTDNKGTVKGDSTTKNTDNTWSFLGLAWYWWLLIVAAIVAVWWFIAARRRVNQNI